MEHSTELKLQEYYIYKEFLNKCKIKKYDKNLVLHNHHIIPRHLWDGDNLDIAENIVVLSVIDHCNAHLLLAKCFTDNSYENISNLRSARIIDNKSIRDKETMQLIADSMKGKNNPFYGKMHTKESLDKMSSASLNQTYGTYEERYGDNADVEKQKRKAGVTKSWESLTYTQRKLRSKNISKSLIGKMLGSKNGNSHSILVDGKYYGSISEATQELKISRYYLFKNHIIIKTNKRI